MNHSVLDVLMYLFETFSEQEHDEATDQACCGRSCSRPASASPKWTAP